MTPNDPTATPRPDDRDDAPTGRLADALRALRAEDPSDAALVRAAADAWARLASAAGDAVPDGGGHRLVDDADFAARARDFVAGRLSAAETLLFEDRLAESAAVRAAVAAARGRVPARAPRLARAPRRLPIPRWALAAAAAVTLAVAGLLARDTLLPGRVMAQVAEVDGRLYHVDGARGMTPLAASAPIHPRQRVRTDRDGGAVLVLGDGSRLEMDARSEIALASAWNGTTVRLLRGNVIVQAADQKSGRLYVATDDARAAVKGTIFAVRSGASGSRVSVLEGAVDVTHDGQRTRLGPGGQLATRAGLTPVPVGDDFSWSRDRERYLAILAELRALGDEISSSVPRPAPRTASALLDALPADTVFFLSLPNLTETVEASYALFRRRVADSPTLSAWWSEVAGDPAREADLTLGLETLTALGSPLGEEIVVALGLDAEGAPARPVLLASVDDETALRAALADGSARMAERVGEPLPVHLYDDRAALDAAAAEEAARVIGVDWADVAMVAGEPAGASGGDPGAGLAAAPSLAAPPPAEGAMAHEGDALAAWIGDGLLVASPSAATLAATLDGGPGGGAAPSQPFRDGIAAAYGEGVDWLAAIDLGHVVDAVHERDGADPDDGGTKILSAGLENARYVFITQVERDGAAQYDAAVTFDGDRRGIAGWLAAPAAMGALDYVSPDAAAATAFVVDDPRAAVAELLGWVDGLDRGPSADGDLALGGDLLTALAAPLGGEMAVALDGPLLPEPSWKVVLEVYDEGAMEAALERAVVSIADRALGDRGGQPSLLRGTLSGHATTALVLGDPTGDPLAIWLYDGGYLIAAPNAARLEDALRLRASGVGLTSSPAFREALPVGGQTAFSILSWQNLSPWLNDLGARVGDQLPPALGEVSTAELLEGIAPTLVGGWAEADRIRFSGASERSPLGLETLLGLGAMPFLPGGASSHPALPPGAVDPGGAVQEGPGADPAWEHLTGDLLRRARDAADADASTSGGDR